MWPQMFGPYGEERARGEASTMPAGFVVGFEGGADRRDFLRRFEAGWRPEVGGVPMLSHAVVRARLLGGQA